MTMMMMMVMRTASLVDTDQTRLEYNRHYSPVVFEATSCLSTSSGQAGGRGMYLLGIVEACVFGVWGVVQGLGSKCKLFYRTRILSPRFKTL